MSGISLTRIQRREQLAKALEPTRRLLKHASAIRCAQPNVQNTLPSNAHVTWNRWSGTTVLRPTGEIKIQDALLGLTCNNLDLT